MSPILVIFIGLAIPFASAVVEEAQTYSPTTGTPILHPPPPVPSEKQYTDTWVLHVPAGEARAKEIAESAGFTLLRQVGSLDGHFHIKHVCDNPNGCLPRDRHSHEHTNHFLTHQDVLSATQQPLLKRARRSPVDVPDPLWPHQWYLEQTGPNHIHVRDVWEAGYTGKGVVVTIVDDGIEHDHPDLIDNYDAHASTDINGNDDDPYPNEADPINKHGTRCCGEVAAGKNSYCGVGVAYNSRIGAVRMLDGEISDAVEGSSLSLRPEYIDIYSSSWGPNDDGQTLEEPGPLCKEAFRRGTAEGRDGLGSIYLFASGNGGLSNDDCNADGYTNSIYTIAIGAISEHDTSPWYAEPCAAGVVVTYSSGGGGERSIVSVDLHHGCTEDHSGTSAAAPLAAGILALVLEANPTLSWRDVQHLLIRTAQPFNLEDSGWYQTKAGYHVHHKLYFGKMNADSLVAAALLWKNVGPQVIFSTSLKFPEAAIPSNANYPIDSVTVSLENSPISSLEHVQLIVSLAVSKRGALVVELECPSGTRSTLLSPRPRDNYNGNMEWTLMTTRCWDESPAGEWKLFMHVSDGATGKLNNWSLMLYGTKKVTCAESQFMSIFGECVTCDAQCMGGCSGPMASQCTSCLNYKSQDTCVASCENLVYNFTCVDNCPENMFSYEGTCVSCDAECLGGCIGPGPLMCFDCQHQKQSALGPFNFECVAECSNPKVLNRTTSQCDCMPGYFQNPNFECQPCHPECRSCFGSGAYQCAASCRHAVFQGSCLSACPNMTYISASPLLFIEPSSSEISVYCLPCDSACVSDCSGPLASDCLDGSAGLCQLHQFNDICVVTCPVGTYAEIGTGICLPCHEECDAHGCTAGDDMSCLSCRHFRHSKKCVPACPSDMYADEHNVCRHCNFACARGCIGPYADQCCAAPSQPSGSICCSSGECALQCRYVTYDGTCLASCPTGTYLDGALCQPCDEKCLHCVGPWVSDCLLCRNYMYESICVDSCDSSLKLYADANSKMCQKCDVACIQGCTGPTADDCTLRDCSSYSCPSEKVLDADCQCVDTICQQYKNNNHCVDECPSLTFADTNRLCQPCHSECSVGCTGPSNHECQACVNFQTTEGECVATCPALSFIDDRRTCIACHPECSGGCAGDSDEDCLACKHVKYGSHCLNKCPSDTFTNTTSCSLCYSECMNGCKGPRPSDCIGCKHYLYQGSCVEQCPQNTYAEHNTCHPCHDQCLIGCSSVAATDCLHGFCKSYKVNTTFECVKECPFGTYQSGYICAACHLDCTIYGCFGPAATNCLALHLVNTTVSAVNYISFSNSTDDQDIIDVKVVSKSYVFAIVVVLACLLAVVGFLMYRSFHKGTNKRYHAKYMPVNNDDDFSLAVPQFRKIAETAA